MLNNGFHKKGDGWVKLLFQEISLGFTAVPERASCHRVHGLCGVVDFSVRVCVRLMQERQFARLRTRIICAGRGFTRAPRKQLICYARRRRSTAVRMTTCAPSRTFHFMCGG